MIRVFFYSMSEGRFVGVMNLMHLPQKHDVSSFSGQVYQISREDRWFSQDPDERPEFRCRVFVERRMPDSDSGIPVIDAKED
jgi:hypothetical protein